MKKIKLTLGILAFVLISLQSCSKGCYTCTAGEWEDFDLCSTDGYGQTSMKMFKENCKAGGGKAIRK